MKAQTGRIFFWRECSRTSIHCEKILILDGIENGGFLTRCAQSTVADKDHLMPFL